MLPRVRDDLRLGLFRRQAPGQGTEIAVSHTDLDLGRLLDIFHPVGPLTPASHHVVHVFCSVVQEHFQHRLTRQAALATDVAEQEKMAHEQPAEVQVEESDWQAIERASDTTRRCTSLIFVGIRVPFYTGGHLYLR